MLCKGLSHGSFQGTLVFVLISLLGVGPMVPHFLVQGHFLKSKKTLCRSKLEKMFVFFSQIGAREALPVIVL
jgi:hypothetical protein